MSPEELLNQPKPTYPNPRSEKEQLDRMAALMAIEKGKLISITKVSNYRNILTLPHAVSRALSVKRGSYYAIRDLGNGRILIEEVK